MTTLRCDQEASCTADVTHIDDKGYVYCAAHGIARRMYVRPCRRLRPWEKRRLERGTPLARY